MACTSMAIMLMLPALCGADDDDADDSPASKFQTKVETPLIGDYTTFAGLSPVVIEGVGLVVGLNGTGGDPAPSMYRTLLLEDMKKNKVENPNKLLADPNTALVVVRAYLPPLMAKGETIDVDVTLPESAQATSLAGGWLMRARLGEQTFVPGRGVLEGHVFASAVGPILVGAVAGGAKKDELALLKKGRVLGGGTVVRERELSIYLSNEFRSVRNSTRIAEAIGRRFHDYNKHGIKEPMATAKTDTKIVLKVHPRYKDNYPRYLQIIRHIAFRETAVAQRVRLQSLARDLLIPEKAEKAALELEAIGPSAIPTLKTGLKAPTTECQFYAACALAYLDDDECIPVLAAAAKDEPAFRVFALAALSTIDDAEAQLKLRELMNEKSAETRYGAFRAMWVADKEEPFIRGIPLRNNQYHLHVLETTGEPMVHVTMHTRPEIVLFGARQEFATPLYVSAGSHVMVTAPPGSQKVSVARFEPGKPDQKREVSLHVAEVIEAAAELGANYPDIVQMLAEADRQHNFEGRMALDALPQAGRYYERPELDEGVPVAKRKSQKARVGKANYVPNLFPAGDSGAESANSSTDDGAGGQASIPSESSMNDGDKYLKSETPSILKWFRSGGRATNKDNE
jgi:flagellar basal body P-ring protein FlgI